jgi:hypothetical protein
MYLLIVFVWNMDSLDFLILIPNLCIFWINPRPSDLIFTNCICIEYRLFGFPYFNSEFMYSLD